jgi:hypothetical protein
MLDANLMVFFEKRNLELAGCGENCAEKARDKSLKQQGKTQGGSGLKNGGWGRDRTADLRVMNPK